MQLESGLNDDDFGKVEGGASLNRGRCDLQVVDSGSGKELYFNVLREFKSVGAPSWESRSAESHTTPNRFSLYACGLDKGPDCQLFSRLLRSAIVPAVNVACCTVWCFFHQFHLGYKSHIAFMEGFVWKDVNHPAKFHGGIATIANVWRSHGFPRKLEKVVAKKFGEEAAERVAKRPGRALRGRWGSAHEVIVVILQNIVHLPTGFVDALTGDKKANTKPKAKAKAAASNSVGADEDAECREKLLKWKAHAVELLKCPCFQGMLHVSHVVGGVLDYFRVWGQKRKKEFNKAVEQHSKDDCAYLGPTMLSELVMTKAVDIRAKFDWLLEEESLVDVERFAKAVHAVSRSPVEEHHHQVLELIVGATLSARATWECRFVDPTTSFPLLLLMMSETPPNVHDHCRQSVAQLLWDADDASLQSRHSDLAFKIRRAFRDEVDVCRRTGRCPLRLYSVLKVVRASLQGDTQDIEGDNSILQVMANRARRMRIALASSRMQLKRGPKITAADCVAVHHEVCKYMETEENAQRFAPLVVHDDKLPNLVADLEVGEEGEDTYKIKVRAACRAHACYNICELGAAFVYTLGPVSFLSNWSFYTTLWVSAGSTSKLLDDGHDGSTTFYLAHPLRVRPLMEMLSDVAVSEALDAIESGAVGKNRKRKRNTLVVIKIPLQWRTTLTAVCDMAGAKELPLPIARKKKSKPKAAAIASPAPLADAAGLIGEAAADDDDDYDDGILEKMIGEVLDEAGIFGKEPTDDEDDPGEDELFGSEDDGHEPADCFAPEPGVEDVAAAGVDGAGGNHPVWKARDVVQAAIATSVEEQVSHHVGLLREARAAIAERPPNIGPKLVSLVSHDGAAFFVWWDDSVRAADVETHLGWRIRLDRRNRIIYTIPYKKTRETFRDLVIIVPDLPVYVWKETGPVRHPMPEWAVLAQLHAQARLYSGPLEKDRPNRYAHFRLSDECVFCQACVKHGADRIDDGPGWHSDVFVCKVCCFLWHAQCAMLYVGCEELAEQDTMHFIAKSDVFHFDHAAFVCPVC